MCVALADVALSEGPFSPPPPPPAFPLVRCESSYERSRSAPPIPCLRVGAPCTVTMCDPVAWPPSHRFPHATGGVGVRGLVVAPLCGAGPLPLPSLFPGFPGSVLVWEPAHADRIGAFNLLSELTGGVPRVPCPQATPAPVPLWMCCISAAFVLPAPGPTCGPSALAFGLGGKPALC